MSLKLTNKATAKQVEILNRLEYGGMGRYAASNLTVQEAAKLIDELFTEQKYTYSQIIEIADGYYDIPENQLDDKYIGGNT